LKRRAVGQIGPLDPDVDDLDAIFRCVVIQLVANVVHHALPLRRQERGKRLLAEFIANVRAQDRLQLRL